MRDYNKEMNFFDEERLAKDWLNQACNMASYDIFRKQEDICYMAGELGKGRKPKLKDDAIDVLYDIVEDNMGLVIEYVVMFFLKDMLDNDIECSPEVAWEVNDWYCENLYEGRDD